MNLKLLSHLKRSSWRVRDDDQVVYKLMWNLLLLFSFYLFCSLEVASKWSLFFQPNLDCSCLMCRKHVLICQYIFFRLLSWYLIGFLFLFILLEINGINTNNFLFISKFFCRFFLFEINNFNLFKFLFHWLATSQYLIKI